MKKNSEKSDGFHGSFVYNPFFTAASFDFLFSLISLLSLFLGLSALCLSPRPMIVLASGAVAVRSVPHREQVRREARGGSIYLLQRKANAAGETPRRHCAAAATARTTTRPRPRALANGRPRGERPVGAGGNAARPARRWRQRSRGGGGGGGGESNQTRRPPPPWPQPGDQWPEGK